MYWTLCWGLNTSTRVASYTAISSPKMCWYISRAVRARAAWTPLLAAGLLPRRRQRKGLEAEVGVMEEEARVTRLQRQGGAVTVQGEWGWEREACHVDTGS